MVPHLSKCVFVAPDVKARALEEINGKKNRGQENPPSLGRSVSMPVLSVSTSSDQVPYYPNAGWSTGISGTPSPAPSPLLLSAPLVNLERPPKRPRTSSFGAVPSPLAEGSGSGSSSPVTRPWNQLQQQEFGEDFCKLLVAIRSAWNIANNPQMRLFIDNLKWIPGAIVPDRRTLSGPILDREAGKVEEKLKLKLKGRNATFQTDGWKNKAKQAIVATMVSVDFEVSVY
jgi:hypothetical protein